MFNKRAFRISAGILILLVVLYTAIPFIYKFNSLDGVVNGRIAALRTPIPGALHFARKTAYGSVFKKGELIAEVANNRIDHATLATLRTEKSSIEGRIFALGERIDSLKRLFETLTAKTAKYKEFSSKQLQYMIEQERHRLSQEQAENARAQKELESSSTLNEKSMVSKRDLERHEANLTESKARISQLENRIKELGNTLDAINSGVFLGDGHNDVPYSNQRMDQLVVDITLSESARDEAKARQA